MKKLFGGIDLTWKKLIISAVVIAIYTALMAIIPITNDTSFRDISVYFEWWILFGIIIICNSKSPLDSAFKCFVFFLISQPLIYLFQVPFSHMGWQLFGYYKYWFIWTLLCFPMGFIGYYIKKGNILSVIILFPMLLFLSYLGLGYLSSVIENFPHHLLSCIACFAMIIIIVISLFDKKVYKIVILSLVLLSSIIFLYLKGGLTSTYETYKNMQEYHVNLQGEVVVSFFSGTRKGNVQVIHSDGDSYTVKLSGMAKGEYKFTLEDEKGNSYSFEYHYDEKLKTIVLNKTD